MALFTDGALNTLLELQSYENGILDLASAENIDVTGKSAIAREQIGTELMLFVRRNHLCPGLGLEPMIGLENIVVDGPLKRWHAYQTLCLIYQDAYNNQLNDRYQGKWTEYQRLSSAAERTVFEIGIGVAIHPVPKASAPEVNPSLPSSSGTSCYLCASWVSNTGQEGIVSDLVQGGTADGGIMQISMSDAPNGVTGWNLYAGYAPDAVTVQNIAPIGLADTWTGTGTELTTGRGPMAGQKPELRVVERRIIQRG